MQNVPAASMQGTPRFPDLDKAFQGKYRNEQPTFFQTTILNIV